MENKRESDLWKQIDKLIFINAILGLVVLIGAYFFIANLKVIDPVLRELILSVITNIIPTSLLFIGAYLVFRRIEKLRSEKNTDELADKVAIRLIEIVKIQTSAAGENSNFLEGLPEISELYLKLSRELEVTNKFFDNKLEPQKLVIQFTNRGSNIINLKKITYSDITSGLPKAALSKNYRLDNGYYVLIPINQAEILPGNKYVVELLLDGKWDEEKINGWTGKWGYLHLEVVYGDETIDLQYPI